MINAYYFVYIDLKFYINIASVILWKSCHLTTHCLFFFFPASISLSSRCKELVAMSSSDFQMSLVISVWWHNSCRLWIYSISRVLVVRFINPPDKNWLLQRWSHPHFRMALALKRLQLGPKVPTQVVVPSSFSVILWLYLAELAIWSKYRWES